ncbi:hypothetical protein H257_08094 [Aphanomyces astaci]|uniref:Chromo domain-containing protein n=1 Tax=Aphanomyces astaci TaxID=112090 RepID=W4GI49_APHAT|nr:hypothetical protein H257_08094 [Aphanomyces astaci]ETV78598.1 hypothetical protein H257_08094 [Aphanomyces astaci]|eukprot:XP_009832179.1 hypothetical protein H257_08094 [Aphanomyces astaci]
MGHQGHQAMAAHMQKIFYIRELDTKLTAWTQTCLLYPHTRGDRVVQRPQQYAWHATHRNEGLQFDFLFMGEAWRTNINRAPVATLDHTSSMECFTGLDPTTALIVGKVNWELLIRWNDLMSLEASWEQLPAMHQEIPSLVQSFADQLLNGAIREGPGKTLERL